MLQPGRVEQVAQERAADASADKTWQHRKRKFGRLGSVVAGAARVARE